MKKAIAKKLRGIAEDQTIGKPKVYTRTIYRQLKRTWKKNMKKSVEPVFKISRRKRRLSETLVLP